MFAHNQRLQHTVRVSEPNPGVSNLMSAQFGGPQGALAAEPLTGAELGMGVTSSGQNGGAVGTTSTRD